MVYTAGNFANAGNYKGFGDTKIIPGVPLDKMQSLIFNAQFSSMTPEEVKYKWDETKDKFYSLSDREKQLGLGEKVCHCYSNIVVAVNYFCRFLYC